MAASQTLGVRIPERVLVSLDEYARAQELTRSKAIAVLVEEALAGRVIGPSEERTSRVHEFWGQDTASGQRAQQWGVQTARKIAAVLGADKAMDQPNANEFFLDGKRIAIKCARVRTTQCGLTNTMRDRVDYIVCAAQTVEGAFNLYRVTPEQWQEHANEPPERNRNHGYLTHLSRSVFRRVGEDLGEVEIED